MYNPNTGRYEQGWRPEYNDEPPVDPGLIHVGGEGRWQDWVNTKTGEHSVKRHELRVVKQWCKQKDHNYVLKNGKTRLVECSHCGHERTFVLGMQKLENGKIIDISPESTPGT